ncbi:DUF3883 domain-containing protein [Desertihabitans brevis]|uniref:DUF3883 domain-containing protein n=1 Tax=Desertihabitans brevis TaxID=2268447 RepID=A0A367YYY0_9ACTN|nr:DUF3883 domain-containing protein [Desertihabitans brevis]
MVLESYLAMLTMELSGQPYNKSAHNEQVRQVVQRSKGSVERKLQNISSILRDLQAPFINGYKPLPNVQGALRTAVTERWVAARDLHALTTRALARVPSPRWDVQVLGPPAAAPIIELDEARWHEPVGRHIDFVALEEANRSLGLAGELAVLKTERTRLVTLGRPDLADRVEHVSQTQGDGLGFDILSFDSAGSERLLEVKTTRRSQFTPFSVTRHELAVSQKESERYSLVRVFNFETASQSHYRLAGDLGQACRLAPTNWDAVPR